MVVESREHSDVPADKLRAAFEVIDNEPTFDAGLLALLIWAAEYYRHPVGEVLTSALPVMLRTGAPLREERFLWRLTELGREQALSKLPQRSIRLRAIATYLTSHEHAAASEILSATESPLSALRNLESRGYVEQFVRNAAAPAPVSVLREGPALNEAQASAVERIQNSLGSFASHLLYGVTGSGKTEVYLHVIATRPGARPAGAGAGARDRADAAAHRALSRALRRAARGAAFGLERRRAARGVARARAGAARIVIGTRSAMFAPLPSSG